MSPSSDPDAQLERLLELKDDCLMWREVGEEIVVLDKRTWTYMGINGSGSMLFQELARGTTFGGLVECLCTAFGLDRAAALHDAQAFVTMLESHELLVEEAGRSA
jgi:hypothetical protein